MNDERKPDSEGRSATAEPLRIGVHVLAQFAFCPRAGLVAYEQQADDSGEEHEEIPRLDYLPDYEIPLLEEALAREWGRLGKFAFWIPPFLTLVLLVGLWFGGVYAGALLIASSWSLGLLREPVARIRELARRLQNAHAALPREPDVGVPLAQDVHWWSLLKAGFEPVRSSQSYVDRELALAGRPWLVLRRGSVRVPVFRKWHGGPELFPPHHLRLTAYRHLIQVSEGGEVPYGIVLFADGNDGVAIFPNDDDWRQVLATLEEARAIIRRSLERRENPSAPEYETVCRRCPLGRPRRHRPGKSESIFRGRSIAPHLSRGLDERLYHSTCGDRFTWEPPHEEFDTLGFQE